PRIIASRLTVPRPRATTPVGHLGPITKSEPVSIGKPEPPLAAGQGSGCQARTTIPLGTQGDARSDVASGMWRGGEAPVGEPASVDPTDARSVAGFGPDDRGPRPGYLDTAFGAFTGPPERHAPTG